VVEPRRTKIVATLGPASLSEETLRELVRAGVDVFRLNFSHGTPEEHRQTIGLIRRICRELDTEVGVLQDLPGPKVRLGPVAEGVVLRPGDRFVLTVEQVVGDQCRASVSHPELIQDVRPGDRVLLADGQVELRVLQTTDREALCEVLSGGPLASHKGVNVPRGLRLGALTQEDRFYLRLGAQWGVDLVALSFVSSARDIQEARRILQEVGAGDIPLIAKIERAEALDRIDEILGEADGLMVARGDLGVEIPQEEVPLVQKELIGRANVLGRPVVTATQMLRSMVDSPRPTRAEVTDVANAVLDGTDALMLSEETAIGRWPLLTVQTMDAIARAAERKLLERPLAQHLPGRSIEEAISHAACTMAQDLKAALIVTPTESGATARNVARWRPAPPILAISPSEATIRRLKLCWGVVPRRSERFRDFDHMMEQARRLALESGMAAPGQTVVFTAGLPVGTRGATNLIKAERL